MSENPHHPYALEILQGPKPGTFLWAIRRNGTLIQRADKMLRSVADAQKDGEKAIERQFADAQAPDSRRR